MKAKTIMVQGTGSSVGKSVLVTALCRILRQDGYSVAPFKSQNMSLNSYVTPDWAEIGRAQAVQAEAAMVVPTAEMNPILLKPEVDYRSQLIVLGRPKGRLESRNFNKRKEDLWGFVTESLDKVRSEFEVLLVGDIDRGGVFASLYGTMMLLSPEERELVRGTVISKFRGDVSLLRPGLRDLEALTGVPVLGVVPYFRDIYVPEEDSPAGRIHIADSAGAVLDVVVVALPHIANFDDFDPLAREPGVELRYVRTRNELGSPDLVIIPGTKTTVADLRQLRDSGMAVELERLAREGAAFIGICGGYQMLGRRILDPDRVEADCDEVAGLGLLPVVTRFESSKQTYQVSGSVSAGCGLLSGLVGAPIEGYEIHMGATTVDASGSPDASLSGREAFVHPFRLSRASAGGVHHGDGSITEDGWIMGTYLHGMFHNRELRRNILKSIAARKGVSLPLGGQDFSQTAEYDKLAGIVRTSLDMDELYRVAGLAVE